MACVLCIITYQNQNLQNFRMNRMFISNSEKFLNFGNVALILKI
jgi:hypothetical protein